MTSVGIIGAGPAGLVAAKSALECGLEPTVFEKASDIGGLWRPDTGYTWDSMKTNISYYSCMFSDFAWKGAPDIFPNQRKVHEYLQGYVSEFQLTPHINLQTKVIRISKENEKWKIQWQKSGEVQTKIFDFLIVSSGFFSKPITPTITGMESFTGTALHASAYKSPEIFSNKSIVVIGNAFSGAEIASELAMSAKRVVNSTHKAFWVLPRTLSAFSGKERKLPVDFLFYSREAQARSLAKTEEKRNSDKHAWFKAVTGQEKISQDLVVEQKETDPQFTLISDSYLEHVAQKRIEIKKSAVTHVEEDRVFFEDGTINQTDAIIFATGYKTTLPFFDKEILQNIEFSEEDSLQPLLLHKTVFHPALSNMAFVGMYRGPFFAVMELQARLACMVFSKKIEAPTDEAMQEGISSERKIRQMVPRPQFSHGDYVALADDLAKQISVLPDYEADKRLWSEPLIASHYRLTGFANKPDVALKIIEQAQELNANGILM
jgi:dimethylaniline monooxygenase (N-oxide forming)